MATPNELQAPSPSVLLETLGASLTAESLQKLSNRDLMELRYTAAFERGELPVVSAEIARRNAIISADRECFEALKAAAKRDMSVAEMNLRLFGATGLGGK